MRRYIAWPFAGLLLCLAAGWVYADYDQAMGEIKLVDVAGGKLTVAVRAFGAARDAAPKEVTYLIDKDTTVWAGGRDRAKKALADLAEGKSVQIIFKEADKAGDLPKAIMVTIFDRGMGAGRGGNGGGGGGGRRGGNGGGGGGNGGGGGGGAAN